MLRQQEAEVLLMKSENGPKPPYPAAHRSVNSAPHLLLMVQQEILCCSRLREDAPALP
jgi:hypothetical protein